MSTAQEEDARLEDFLRETVTPSHPRSAPARQVSRAAAAAAATIAPAVDPEATLDVAGPQVGTDPKSEQSLPGGQLLTPAAKQVRRPPRPPWWQDWRKLAAAGAGGLLLVLLGVWVIVRNKEGREVARVAVPDGGSATVETADPRARSGKPEPDFAPGDEARWGPWEGLFDGKTLAGWQRVEEQGGEKAGTVRAEDGLLVLDKNPKGFTGAACTRSLPTDDFEIA